MKNDDTGKLADEDGSPVGNALLLAMRGDMQSLFELVRALDQKVEARLRDTTPMWEVVVARLDTIVAEQENHGRRLDAIEGRLDAIEGRLDAIEIKLERFDAIDTELRHLRRRIERTIGQLSKNVVEYRVDQHDLEDRLEKLEKTPA